MIHDGTTLRSRKNMVQAITKYMYEIHQDFNTTHMADLVCNNQTKSDIDVTLQMLKANGWLQALPAMCSE